MSSNMNRRAFIGASLWTLALTACGSSTQDTTQSSSATDESTKTDEPGKVVNDVLVTPYDEGYSSGFHHATIEVADYGTIKLELNATNTPITVSNFAHLANEKFYDGLTFHRIIEGFMVQGGDPNGNGSGGTKPTIKGEFSENGVVNAIRHTRGVISMARSQGMDSASSQFFIMHEANDSLDGKYAAFGKVTDGMDVVDKLAKVPVLDDNGTVEKKNQPKITSIRMDD